MKQIVIISGKGGTGKTVTTASFAALAKNSLLCDCDVDAADLHLLLHPQIKETHQFKGGKKAIINEELCNGCGECVKVCRFNAISSGFTVEPISCEGCFICSYVCPVDAIKMEENIAGEWYVSGTKYGPMVHAKLGIAQENSGKLVSVVREAARKIGTKNKVDWIIIDGPPGIGCPVIASLSGVDIAVIVTEPSLSGIHDLKRISGVAAHFRIKMFCIINRYDINYENSEKIMNWCKGESISVIGKIPFEKQVTEALIEGKPVVEYSENPATKEIKRIWRTISDSFTDD